MIVLYKKVLKKTKVPTAIKNTSGSGLTNAKGLIKARAAGSAKGGQIYDHLSPVHLSTKSSLTKKLVQKNPQK